MDGSEMSGPARDANGRFLRGPGRKLGSRNRVSKRVAQAFLDDFERNQGETLARSRRWFLPQYLQVISRLLPRQSEEEAGLGLETLSRDEALAVVAALRVAADRYEAGEGSLDALEAALLGGADGDGGP